MSRYIDADRLLDALYEHEFTILCPLDEVSNVIDEQPTADVVEVVRCRDCKHSRDEKQPHYCEVWRRYKIVSGNGFCVYGERKVQE